jgi:hypothetical protein
VKFGGSIYDAQAIDRWYRFAKNRRPWAVPQLSTPVQGDRWSDLMPIVTLAVMVGSSACGTAPFTAGRNRAVKLTPGRVAQSFGSILAVLGTPAQPPKLRGKSPGWISGRKRRRRIRYPAVKKGLARTRKPDNKSP